jgi:hypothetical protein
MTDKIPFLPEQSGYAGRHPDQVVEVELDGGESRFRADVLGGTSEVNASWVLDREQYATFHRFWVQNTERGALEFLADLVLDSPLPSQYAVRCMPGTYRTTSVRGLSYGVSMRLQVRQPEGLSIANYQLDGSAGTIARTEGGLQPVFDELFAPGDDVGFYGFTSTPVAADLSGIYVVSAVSGDLITLSSPSAVNPNWSLLTVPSNNIVNAMVVKVDT